MRCDAARRRDETRPRRSREWQRYHRGTPCKRAYPTERYEDTTRSLASPCLHSCARRLARLPVRLESSSPSARAVSTPTRSQSHSTLAASGHDADPLLVDVQTAIAPTGPCYLLIFAQGRTAALRARFTLLRLKKENKELYFHNQNSCAVRVCRVN